MKGEGALSLSSVYPNPTNDEVRIDFLTDSGTDVNLRIIDLFGRVVREEILVSSVGSNSHTTDLSELVAGQYFVVLRSGRKAVTHRIIKR